MQENDTRNKDAANTMIHSFYGQFFRTGINSYLLEKMRRGRMNRDFTVNMNWFETT
jgi:hypothetical protein